MLKLNTVFHWDQMENDSFQFPLPARASQTLKPGMQALKGNFWPLYSLARGSICSYMFERFMCPRKAIHSGVRPQATGNDTSEEPCQCVSQTPEDVASATVI